jgi:formylglycine-generating enzyme required for sulfatase activity
MLRHALTVAIVGSFLAACSDAANLGERDGGGGATPGDSGSAPSSSSGTAGAPGSVASGGSAGGASGGSGGSEAIVPARIAPGEWVALEAGSFVMGAEPSESCFTSDNQDRHQVTLTHRFEIGATEVTQADSLAMLGRNTASFQACGEACPLELVRWHDAAAYCNALSDYAELPRCYACSDESDRTCAPSGNPYDCVGYRLPTEAEWEYAYRAGTSSALYNGDIESCGSFDAGLDAIGWFLYNGAGTTHPVATKAPNAWGLHDMAGNVWEWTHDGYASSLSDATDPVIESGDGLRVMRGGSYNCVPGELRAAHRSGLPEGITGQNVGLRCARTLH